MLQKFILRRLAARERLLGESLDYLRHRLRHSPRAFFKFSKVVPMASYRRTLPADAYHVARIVTMRDMDCGTCVRIEIKPARQDGVHADVLRAVIDAAPDALTPKLADVYRFTKAALAGTADEGLLREAVREHYGEEGLVELALAVAACRVFPTAKKMLGYATSCSLVPIDVPAEV